MLKDSYVENSKKKYILRSGELLGKVWNEAYLEFSHQQFNIKDCDKIIATLKETFNLSLPRESSGADPVNEEDEKEDDTINMGSILSECGKRSWRRKRNTRIKIEPMDREEVERAFKNLQKL